MEDADGRYGVRPWDRGKPAAYVSPSSPWEESTVVDAVSSLRTPGVLLALKRPPLPQVGRDPRFGYSKSALGILDVLGETRLYPTRAGDYSGSPGGYSGSIRNSLEGV